VNRTEPSRHFVDGREQLECAGADDGSSPAGRAATISVIEIDKNVNIVGREQPLPQ